MDTKKNQQAQVSRPRQENQMETTQEIDLGDLFLYLWSKIVYLLLALVIGAGAGGAITYFLITPTYRASSYLYMVAASSGTVVDLSDLNIGTNVSSDYEQLLILLEGTQNNIQYRENHEDRNEHQQQPQEGADEFLTR